MPLMHRRDSIQGTDCITNYFFLNLRVSWAKIENRKWQIGGDIIPLTFGKYVMLLVKKLKILRKKLTCSQYLDWQFLLSLNILSFWTYNVTNFPKVSGIISPLIRDFRFSICVPETLELEWQCSQYLELNPTCVMDAGWVDAWGGGGITALQISLPRPMFDRHFIKIFKVQILSRPLGQNPDLKKWIYSFQSQMNVPVYQRISKVIP